MIFFFQLSTYVFPHLGELHSPIPGVPMTAITATSSGANREKIEKRVSMRNIKQVIDSPDIPLCVTLCGVIRRQ